MGDWRTVHIVGTCDSADVPVLARAIDAGSEYQNFHCLCGGVGLGGLPRWAAPKIDVIGNLAERNYDEQSVQRQLEILAVLAPSLNVVVHCGGEYESQDCIATVVLENGKATIHPPQVKTIGEVPEGQMLQNLFDQLRRQSNE